MTVTESTISILISVIVFGTCTNILALIMSFKNKENHSNYLIMALSTSDLISTSILLPLTIYLESVDFEINSLILCKFYHFLNTSIVPASCLFLTTIALERLVLICFTRIYCLSKLGIALLILVLVLVSLILGIVPTMAVGLEKDILKNGTTIYTCTHTFENIPKKVVLIYRNFHNSIYLCSMVIVTIACIFIYIGIFKRHKTQMIRYQQAQQDEITQYGNENISEQLSYTSKFKLIIDVFIKDIRIFLKLLLIFLLFIVTHFPPILVIHDIIDNSSSLYYLFFLNSAFNPVIYCLCTSTFFYDLKKVF